MDYTRKDFIRQASVLTAIALISPAIDAFSKDKGGKHKIILRSSWQTVNIGDIAHTPGVLTLLEKYLPDAEIHLWPSDIGNGVEAMLQKRFPKLILIKNENDIKAALKECHFMLHGSGPSLVGHAALERWDTETGKPFGIYGITFPGNYAGPDKAGIVNPLHLKLLNKASFAFFRDSVSLKFAKDHGVKSKVMEFCPDGAFAIDLKNDEVASKFLKDHQLEEGKFLCCIPHVRFTPYWEIPEKKRAVDPIKLARNEAMKEHDISPLREAIIAVVRQTNLKVLVCPEVETQVALGKEMIMDKLPEDVKKKVVWRDRYWLTDEAISTYTRSAGLFALDMHSPIMCIGHDIPAIVCRFYEQTSKGYMWRDIGLSDWLFDMDKEAEVAKVVSAVLEMAKNPQAAKQKAIKARKFVERRQRETMNVLIQDLKLI